MPIYNLQKSYCNLEVEALNSATRNFTLERDDLVDGLLTSESVSKAGDSDDNHSLTRVSNSSLFLFSLSIALKLTGTSLARNCIKF